MANVLGVTTTRNQVPSERTVINEALNDLNISGGGSASTGFFKDNAVSSGANLATAVYSGGGDLGTPVAESINGTAWSSALEDTQIGKPTNRGKFQEVQANTYSAGSYSIIARA
jgi:hypothetical protein